MDIPDNDTNINTHEWKWVYNAEKKVEHTQFDSVIKVAGGGWYLINEL